ncbi:MAG TPA: hypothetical protein VJ948_06380 [Acidimicrobiia bacterium]|nr:hypothetical protein [Acidimicrobiia bacterium]
MSTTQRSWEGWLVPLGLILLVGGLVAIAMLRGPVELDPDTPEGTVQEYLLAINEERWDDAAGVIHPEWLGGCDGEDLSRVATIEFSAELGHDGLGGGVLEERFVEIGEEPLPGGDTHVEVTITHTDQGGLGSGWSEYVTFDLVDEDDFWWIVNDPWPYFVWSCRE